MNLTTILCPPLQQRNLRFVLLLNPKSWQMCGTDYVNECFTLGSSKETENAQLLIRRLEDLV